MDSPITISSSSMSSFTSHRERKAAGEDPQKRPRKYWDTKYIRSDSSSTLSQLQKVKDWINSINEVDGERRAPPEPSGLIVMRYDYDKPRPPKQRYKTMNPFNRSTSLIDYIKEKTDINTLAYLTNGIPKTSSAPQKKDKSDEHSEYFELRTAMESQKRELCSYLKLMDPADKKEIFILPNRRSTRVRNLEAMQKRKQLDKEINDLERDAKSAKGSNQDGEGAGGSEGDYFHFPFPPKEFTSKVRDFDATMSMVIPEFRNVVADKNVASPTQGETVKNKEKVRNDTIMNKKLQTKRKSQMESSKIKADKRNNNVRQESVPVFKHRLRRIKHRLRQSKFHKHNNIKKKKPQTKPKPEMPMKQKQVLKIQLHKTDILLPEPTINSPTALNIVNPPSNSRCEIITISPNSEYQYDPTDFIDDMSDYELFSEEHKRSLIESRIFSTKPGVPVDPPSPQAEMDEAQAVSNETELVNLDECKPDSLMDDCKPDSSVDERKAESSVDESKAKSSVDESKAESCADESKSDSSISESELDSSVDKSSFSESTSTTSRKRNTCLEVCPRSLKKDVCDIQPFDKSVEQKSLQKSLQFVRRRQVNFIDSGLSQEWEAKVKRQSHYIKISDENGDVLRAFYVDYNLVVCQEFAVSFWMQTALGNILGSQNMWIPLGRTQRIVLNNKCIQRDSKEMVLSIEANVAYIELWTKEHESDKREGPVADIFITIYFWRQRKSGLDKKVLQLENINGFADHVQYCVVKSSPKVIVSWHSANGDGGPSKKKTFIRAYELADDYQTISNIHLIEPVKHYVASLHNIEDCDDLIIGCGDNKITLWNLEHGYLISTIELNNIKTPLSTLWVKCDRGFLFAIQQCMDKELRLIAINSINQSWKKLASYMPSDSFKNFSVKGVCMDNGLLLSFYNQGILCWTAETGEPIEEFSMEMDLIPSGSYVILVDGDTICVKHATTHLLSISTDDV